MAQETLVRSQFESYQRLKKWYLMPPCLTLSIIRYGSRIKWSNPGKGVVPSHTLWCDSYRKGSLCVTLDYGRQLYLLIIKSSARKSFGTKWLLRIWLYFLLFYVSHIKKISSMISVDRQPKFLTVLSSFLEYIFIYFIYMLIWKRVW